jgi:hypothetical protein
MDSLHTHPSDSSSHSRRDSEVSFQRINGKILGKVSSLQQVHGKLQTLPSESECLLPEQPHGLVHIKSEDCLNGLTARGSRAISSRYPHALLATTLGSVHRPDLLGRDCRYSTVSRKMLSAFISHSYRAFHDFDAPVKLCLLGTDELESTSEESLP